MHLQNNQIGWHKLVAQHFDNLADFEVLPGVGTEHFVSNICGENLPIILIMVLLVAPPVFDQVFYGGGQDHNHKGQGHGRPSVCIGHCGNNLREQKDTVIFCGNQIGIKHHLPGAHKALKSTSLQTS